MKSAKSIGDKILSNRFSGKLCVWLLIFASFYYPIAAFFIISLRVPSTPVNIAIKAGAAGVALYLIIIAVINSKKKLTLSVPVCFLIVWWIGYSIRLLYDIEIAGVNFGSKPKSIVYGFAFGNILLPILAAMYWQKYFDIESIPRIIFAFLVVANVLMLVTLIQQNGGFSVEMFLKRASVLTESNDKDEMVLNPIAIGGYGGLLAITSLYFLIVVKNSRWWIYLPFFFFGLLVLMLGASRGPFIMTVAALFVILVYRFRVSYSKFMTLLKYSFLVVAFGVIVANTVGRNLSVNDFTMFKRLSDLVENQQENKEEARDLAWASAWQDFLDSPIIGKQFVGTHDTFYPHNIVLEIPMATGFVGVFFFLGFFIPVVVKMFISYLHRDNEYFFLAVLFIPIFVGKLFSGSLFMSIDLWLMMFFLIAFKVKPKAKIVHVRASRIISPTDDRAYNLQV